MLGEYITPFLDWLGIGLIPLLLTILIIVALIKS